MHKLFSYIRIVDTVIFFCKVTTHVLQAECITHVVVLPGATFTDVAVHVVVCRQDQTMCT